MTEFDADIHNVHAEMEHFLRAVARKEPVSSNPIYLRLEYKNGLKLIDREKRVFNVEESFLSAFRDTYTDKNCNTLSMQSKQYVSITGNSRLTSRASSANESL